MSDADHIFLLTSSSIFIQVSHIYQSPYTARFYNPLELGKDGIISTLRNVDWRRTTYSEFRNTLEDFPR